MKSKAISFMLILWAMIPSVESLADGETPRVRKFRRGPVFQRPAFKTIEDFVEAVRMRRYPWMELLTPDDIPSFDNPADFSRPLADGVRVIHQTERMAIVYADNKPSRTAPFSSVIFLLEKKRNRFHVADFIRRATGYDSYSGTGEPKVLKLRPFGFVHFYFSEFRGGRRWGFDSDEFYIVRNRRFYHTLVLKNDGAYLSPAAPYREFFQSAEVGVSEGRLEMAVHRIWGMEDGGDLDQKFSVAFHWNSRTQRFASADAGRLQLKKPGQTWTADGLPKPPPPP